ncbi:MAG: Uma2 family endonuclease [Planctomycetia bacterium]|nr:Uma2 family endonuclease [Planctomycetia bacterium]
MVVATPPKMTVDEFFKLHGSESNVELVRGIVVRYPMPGTKHGRISVNAVFELESFLRANKLGRAMTNDTLIRITNETTRGADVCYVSYAKLPADQPLPDGVLEIAPDLVIEVRSPSDLWTQLFGKVSEYLQIGVPAVVILDPPTESASVYYPGTRQRVFEKDQTLTIPDVLPGFEVPVARFFEE